MNQELADRLQQEVAKLNPSPVIELYELDSTPCGDGGSVLYFHNGTSGYSVPVSFNGVSYTPMPIMVKGFELTSSGEPPRPMLSILNAGGFISAAVLKLDDLIGARLTRRRTFARFLDGSPEAAPVEYPPDIFVIVQKLKEDRTVVEFELGTGIDLDGVRFPTRTVVAAYCQHIYRGIGCRFAGYYVVADKSHGVLTSVKKFRGSWDSSVTYGAGDGVWFNTGTYEGVFQCLVSGNTTISGASASPLDATLWGLAQKYRGEYIATNSYATNDVVFVTGTFRKQFYIAVRDVPVGLNPPDSIYWMADECSKSLNHCRMRFDPQHINKVPLPFGAFPGTLSIPEI